MEKIGERGDLLLKKMVFLVLLCLFFCRAMTVSATEISTTDDTESSNNITSSEEAVSSTTSSLDNTASEEINDSEAESTAATTEEADLSLTRAATASAFAATSVPDGYHVYTIANYAQFKAALTDTTYTKKYLTLAADIIYGFANGATITVGGTAIESLVFNSDTIIDGAGTYGMYFGYRGTDGYYNTSSPLRVDSSNLNITFRNLKFGNTTYPNSTRAGLVYPFRNNNNSVFASNLNLTLENIDYNISGTGGKAFNFYYGTGVSVTFKGTNNFVLSNTSTSGAEFCSDAKNIYFDQGSETYIKTTSSTMSSVFMGENGGNDLNISLLEGAQLTIDNGKVALLESKNPTLNVGKDAVFNYNSITGGGSAVNGTSLINYTQNVTTKINADENAEMIFQNSKSGSSSWGLNGDYQVVATAPKRILLSSKSFSSGLISNGTLTIQRKDTDATRNFESSTLANNATETSEIQKYNPSNTAFTYNTANTTGKVAVVYQPAVTVKTVSTNTAVAAGQSDLILGETLTYTPSEGSIAQTSYKVSQNDLMADLVSTSDTAQNQVENATNLVADQTLTNQSKLTVQNLLAGDYYIYTKIIDQTALTADGRTFNVKTTSKWLPVTQNIPKGIFVVVPNNLAFDWKMMGNFTSKQYQVINKSNTKVAISVQSIAGQADNQFKIVDSLATDSAYETTLGLKLTAPLDSQSLSLNLNQFSPNQQITLAPYTDTTNNILNVAFSGKYSGPLDGVKVSNYQLSLAIADGN